MLNIDLEKLNSLLKDFYELTKMKICLLDDKGKELAFYPNRLCPFCSFVRSNNKINALCENSDKINIEVCKKTKKTHTYICHLGLLECLSPILYNDNIIAYIMIGQTISESSAFENINKIILENDIDIVEAQKLYNLLTTLPKEKIKASIKILDACASYLYVSKLIQNKDLRIDIKLADYIATRLNENLSVDLLCSKFMLSRVEIYNIFKSAFNASVAEYIKMKRLSKACELLLTSDKKVSEIAVIVGIPDYNYFSKIFKKQFKLSPLQYKKTYKI